MTQRTLPTAVAAACDAVAAMYPAQVVRPTAPAFAEAQMSFWNEAQRQKSPVCFFQPTEAKQVAKALVEVIREKCPFAIKGGGHSSNFEGSSIHNGFQFDLVKLDHVRIADDKQTVDVGPGVRWGNLFTILEKQGVTAVGGRDFGVGVPGFVFGGGLSYHSARQGWGVDNLVSVDIVLASGDLITVDDSSHPDLSKALRGGGAHNFGIVTNMTLKLHPYEGMWGGFHAVTEEYFETVFKAYENYTRNLIEDGTAHMIVDFYRQDGVMVAVFFMGYPGPVENPPIYDEIRGIPCALNTLRLADYSNLAEEMAEVTDCRGKRNAYWTLCMDYNPELIKSAYNTWVLMTEPHSERFRFAFDLNHITPAMRNKAARQGRGNVYGLEGPDEPLTNILLTSTWENESDDKEVTSILAAIGTALESLAREQGKSRSFKYMNYAHQQQDVIASFGEENKAFLKGVAAKYDPEGVFQKLQPAGFKLDGPAGHHG